MTALSSTVEFEVHGHPGLQLVQGTAAASGDTYVSKFGTIVNVQATKKTGGSTTVETTWSGSTITLTCDAADVICLAIWGY